MFVSIQRPEIAPQGSDAAATPGAPIVLDPSPRALHAKLLANAAARRLRAAERLAAARSDDADYWKACCPMVVAKAAALREEKSFAPLP